MYLLHLDDMEHSAREAITKNTIIMTEFLTDVTHVSKKWHLVSHWRVEVMCALSKNAAHLGQTNCLQCLCEWLVSSCSP